MSRSRECSPSRMQSVGWRPLHFSTILRASLPGSIDLEPGYGQAVGGGSIRFANPTRTPISAAWAGIFVSMNRLPWKTVASLRDAIAYLAQSVPEAEHLMKGVQAAAHCVTQSAENGGPVLFARIGMMQAITRHKPRGVFDPSRKAALGPAEAEAGHAPLTALNARGRSRNSARASNYAWILILRCKYLINMVNFR